MMARRYDSYVAHVVRPFFRDHFAGSTGRSCSSMCSARSTAARRRWPRLERALAAVLKAFRPGHQRAGSRAARRPAHRQAAVRRDQGRSYASHEPRSARSAPAAADGARERARSAKRAPRSRSWRWRRSGPRAKPRRATARASCPCIVGVPLPGETARGHDLRRQARRSRSFRAISRPIRASALEQARRDRSRWRRFRAFVRRGCVEPTRAGEIRPAPHIRLDRALDFLIGDWLA